MVDPLVIGYDDVCAVLVTRGDVDLNPILLSLPYSSIVIWDNSKRPYDAGVFGRYIAIAETEAPVIYFQDDDCIVSCHEALLRAYEPGVVVGNAFDDEERLNRYEGTTLLGWGSLFDRDLPWKAFQRYALHYKLDWQFFTSLGAEITFPILTPSKTIAHGVEWLVEDGKPVQQRPNRMWKQPDFYQETRYWMSRAQGILER